MITAIAMLDSSRSNNDSESATQIVWDTTIMVSCLVLES